MTYHHRITAAAALLAAGLFACRTTPPSIVFLPDSPAGPIAFHEQVRPVLETNTVFHPDEPRQRVEPEYIIDDFDRGVDRWRMFRTPRSAIDVSPVPSDRSDRQALLVTYELPRKKQITINPDSVTVRIHRNCRFEHFAGVQFFARAKNNFRVRVTLRERNELISGSVEAVEIWYKDILVSPEWRLYKVDFEDFRTEEYFEQGFIGDDVQDLRRIREIGFTIGNDSPVNERQGEFLLDDVILF